MSDPHKRYTGGLKEQDVLTVQVYFEELKLDASIGIWVGKNNTNTPKVLCMPHWHTAWEILFIRRGEASQILNASAANVAAGNIVIIRPGDVHATTATGEDGCDVDALQRVV